MSLLSGFDPLPLLDLLLPFLAFGFPQQDLRLALHLGHEPCLLGFLRLSFPVFVVVGVIVGVVCGRSGT